jgi:hypothetical protein
MYSPLTFADACSADASYEFNKAVNTYLENKFRESENSY